MLAKCPCSVGWRLYAFFAAYCPRAAERGETIRVRVWHSDIGFGDQGVANDAQLARKERQQAAGHFLPAGGVQPAVRGLDSRGVEVFSAEDVSVKFYFIIRL